MAMKNVPQPANAAANKASSAATEAGERRGTTQAMNT